MRNQYKTLFEKYSLITEDEDESAPYGFMIWYDGTVDEIYMMDEHRQILHDNLGKLGRMLTAQQRSELNDPSDTDLWRVFFKSGCVRMVKDNTGNYFAEGSFKNNKVSPKIKKLCLDEAGMYRRSVTFVEPAQLYLTENDKEDIIAGLETLSEEDPYKLAQDIYNYCIEQRQTFKHTRHPEGYVQPVSNYITNIFERLNIPEVGWPTQRDLVWSYLMDSVTPYATLEQKAIGIKKITRCIEKGLEDRARFTRLQENDKEDIIAGLGELEKENQPLTTELLKDLNYIEVKRMRFGTVVTTIYKIPGIGDETAIVKYLHDSDPDWAHNNGFAFIGPNIEYPVDLYWTYSGSLKQSGKSTKKFNVKTLKDLNILINTVKRQHSPLQENDKEDILAGLGELEIQNTHLPALIKYLSGSRHRGKEPYNSIDYNFDVWREILNNEIAFENGVLDDDFPEYEADMDVIYYHMDRAIRKIFTAFPETVQEIAPGLTLDIVEDALDKWYLQETT